MAFWVDDVPNFPRWDMYPSPGRYIYIYIYLYDICKWMIFYVQNNLARMRCQCSTKAILVPLHSKWTWIEMINFLVFLCSNLYLLYISSNGQSWNTTPGMSRFGLPRIWWQQRCHLRVDPILFEKCGTKKQHAMFEYSENSASHVQKH